MTTPQVPQVLIFDFDGTIADTQATFIKIANRLAPDFGYQTLEPEQINRLRNLRPREVIKASGLPFYKVPFFLRRAKRQLSHEIRNIQPIAGMDEALRELHASGYRLGIVTSNLPANVKIFLELHKLQDLFEFVRAGIAIFGKSRSLHGALRELSLPPSAAVYCGDEVRDIEAAHHCGIRVLAVGWGFNSREALLRAQPDAFSTEPRQLAEAIAQMTHQELTGVSS
ncbi:MAG: HAD-IA family hydrolase [Cyanobacteria bacterium J06641_5]